LVERYTSNSKEQKQILKENKLLILEL